MKKQMYLFALATVFACTMQAEIAVSGKTFLRLESPFQSASPERVALFASEALRQRHKHDRCGSVQFTVFGGRNAKRAEAAAYYLPGGATKLTFNGDVSADLETLAEATYFTKGFTPAEIAQGKGYDLAYATQDNPEKTNYTKFTIETGNDDLAIKNPDGATSTASGQAIQGQSVVQDTTKKFSLGVEDGTGLGDHIAITIADIKGFVKADAIGTVVQGKIRRDTNLNGRILPWNFGIDMSAQVGAGETDKMPTFKSTISPELHRTHWGLGAGWRQHLSEDATGFWLEASTAIQRVKQEMKLNEEVLAKRDDTNLPADWTTEGFSTTSAPKNVTEAFAQSAWNYGKIDGAQSKTRLADLELKLGYQFVAEENYSSSGYLGFVVPTGNKAEAVYMAEPIVGNGKHFALMLGSNSEMILSSDQDMTWSFRCDADARYLLRNTQKRSFDVKTNGEWSRYMMVWPDFATADAGIKATKGSMRKYTPGINVFTRDMHVTPRCQARLNQALVLESDNFRGELGWNVMLRQAEKVALAEAWPAEIAFVDASASGSSLWNADRTIYNDSYQSTPHSLKTKTKYLKSAIQEEDLNLQSASSPMAITNSPYLTLGYAWEEGHVSLGASYEFSKDNSYQTSWMLWGKLGFSF